MSCMNFIQQQIAKKESENKTKNRFHKGRNPTTKFTKQPSKNFKPMRGK